MGALQRCRRNHFALSHRNPIEIHGKIGTPSTTEVWLDGTLLPELGATGDLGSTNFGQFLLGQTGTTGTYDVVFDDVTVSKNQI